MFKVKNSASDVGGFFGLTGDVVLGASPECLG